MRVLQVSKFLRHVGGVETYIAWLAEQLKDAGHVVGFFGMDLPAGGRLVYGADQYRSFTPERDFHGSPLTKLIDGAAAIYSPTVAQRLRNAFVEFRPDVVHFHGTCYQLTSSVFREAEKHRLPSIITAHEYKLTCANQRLWDDKAGTECYSCVGVSSLAKSANILRQTCVKGSRSASVIASIEQLVSDRMTRTYPGLIHAPSNYMREILVNDGYPSSRVKYMDLPWEEWVESNGGNERTTLQFIGRLSVEKGVAPLLHAWKWVEAEHPGLFLRVSGDGSERLKLERLGEELGLKRLEFTGAFARDDLTELLSDCFATVHPSIWAENSPFTVRESLTRGVPAIVSNRGGLPEMVGPETGVVVDPHDSRSFARSIMNVYAAQRAGSHAFERGVMQRAVSGPEHLAWLVDAYQRASAESM